jgi:hypothetical protein
LHTKRNSLPNASIPHKLHLREAQQFSVGFAVHETANHRIQGIGNISNRIGKRFPIQREKIWNTFLLNPLRKVYFFTILQDNTRTCDPLVLIDLQSAMISHLKITRFFIATHSHFFLPFHANGIAINSGICCTNARH